MPAAGKVYPVPGGDSGTTGAESTSWGSLLKKWDAVHHYPDGTPRPVAATPTTIGYCDWGPPTTFPDNTFGYAAVSPYAFINESAVATIEAIGTIRKTLVYQSFREVISSGGTGVANPENALESDPGRSALSIETLTTIVGTNAFLKRLGADIVTPSFGTKVLNIADPLVQQAVMIGARAKYERLGIRSIFCDTENDHISDLGGIGYLPDGVVDENDWENNYALPFYKNVFVGLRAAGIEITINGSGWKTGYHAEGAENRGDSRLRWMRKIAPFVDNFCEEYAFQGVDNVPMDDSIAVTGTAVNGAHSWWRYHLRAVTLACQLGKGYFGWVYPSGSGQSYRFARGSMLLAWDGIVPLAMIVFQDSSIADTSPSYKWDTGYPKIGRDRKQTATASYTWTRQYDNGTIIVNTDPAASHTINSHIVPARDAYFAVGEWF